MESSIYNSALHFNDYAKRNIIFVSECRDAFASISDEEDMAAIVVASRQARVSIARRSEPSDFYYTAAIGYPFQTKPFMNTRYSDGTYPAWYGSKTIETSIHETAYHTMRFLLSEEGVLAEEKIVKKRTVFDVFCKAFLIDLTQKVSDYPDLISERYEFTHQIGKEVQQGGLPGILSPSARQVGGVNLNIFNPAVLHDPKLLLHLKYTISPKKRRLKVTGLEDIIEIDF